MADGGQVKYFFDVGANVGQTFPDYLMKHPAWRDYHVVCIEPSPRHWPKLLDAADRYAQHFQGVTVITAAISGNRPGLVPFYQKTQPLADSLDQTFRTNLSAGYELLVPTLGLMQTVLSVAKEHGDEVVIKLDVEGAEYGILSDLLPCVTSSLIKRIFVEWHDPATVNYEKALRADYARRGVPLEEWLL
jgi:FkbM family methyltransferase